MNNDQETRKAQTKTLFNTLSPDYDAGAGCFAHFGRRLAEVAEINAGARVLDIASGRGAVLFPVAARVSDGGEVVGIDFAEAMAHATSEEAASRGLKTRVSVFARLKLANPNQGILPEQFSTIVTAHNWALTVAFYLRRQCSAVLIDHALNLRPLPFASFPFGVLPDRFDDHGEQPGERQQQEPN